MKLIIKVVAVGFGVMGLSSLGFTSQEQAKSKADSTKEFGVVRMLGSSHNMTATLTQRKPVIKNTPICRDEIGKKIGRLGGMTVEVEGKWKDSGLTPGGRCFSADSFVITKVTSGRKPLVGVLSQKEFEFVVTTDDGKVHNLRKVSSGLKDLVGKKVIIDVKPLTGPKEGKVYKVVSYSAYP